MKHKKLIGLVLGIIIILICGTIIYSKKTKNYIPTSPVVKNTKIPVNSGTIIDKPKMLTQKEIDEKEKDATQNLHVKESNTQKYASLDETQDYIANKITLLLINTFPNEKNNKDILNNKIKMFLLSTMTPSLFKEKFNLTGPTYDLNQLDVEIQQNNDLKFAFNINTNKFIANSNKFISITRNFSAQ